jgi:hypothetical protein
MLHLDRGKVNWPQAFIAVLVLLLEEVKVAGINKIKEELRNYKNSTYTTIPLLHYRIQLLS